MLETICQKKIIAVLTIEDASKAIPVAGALKAGGVTAIELTLRSPAAIDAIRLIAKETEGITIGAGTVLRPGQIEEVMAAGAHFAVSPGLNPRVLKEARSAGIFFAPGVMTPSDIEAALEFDCKLLKFFPAGTAGGMKHLKAMSAPYNHLGLKYIPLGGVSRANVKEILSEKIIAAAGGSWLATPELIKAGDYAQIQKLASEAVAAIA